MYEDGEGAVSVRRNLAWDSGGPWRVQGGAIEVLLNPRLEDGRLRFEVHNASHPENVAMTVELGGTDELRLGEVMLKRLK